MYQAKQESSGQNEVKSTDSYTEIISTLVHTRTEANMLLTEVDCLLRSLYKTDSNGFDSTLATSVRAKTANALSLIVRDSNREEILTTLKKQISELTYLGLTIAFEPTAEVVTNIYTWVKHNVEGAVALDITINASILGGAMIEYRGKVVSSTLLASIENYFTNTNVNI